MDHEIYLWMQRIEAKIDALIRALSQPVKKEEKVEEAVEETPEVQIEKKKKKIPAPKWVDPEDEE